MSTAVPSSTAKSKSSRSGARSVAVPTAPAPGAIDAQAFVDAHRLDASTELFGITELCQEFGITLRALRFYEDKGLLSPRRINGARVYTRRDRARLALILRAKAIGSQLSEIKRYLDLYGDHGEGRSQQLTYVIDRTDTAIAELERKRAQIDETLAELRVINASCKRHLEARRRTANPST
ncbi:MAG: MerR family DNA-binding transcriptional regulator [Rhodoferax sp.]|nr:MerR family DNA-binding transcriptional regulator [Rhodoferax sp.]